MSAINFFGPAPASPLTTTPPAEHDPTGISCRSSGIVVEESDESVFWLTFTGEAGLNREMERQELLAEARELLAIFTQSAKTASANRH